MIFKKFLPIVFLLLANYSYANNAKLQCANATDKSIVMIQFILQDIKQNYSLIGGGISEIKEVATQEFVVKLPQEERVDTFRYQLSIDKHCVIKILKKEEQSLEV